jgi:Zn-dependent M28 family amino/carboxypeptidase
MKDRIRGSCNVVGYADNAAGSTVVATAHLDDDSDVAALLELAKLLKNKQYRTSNYLFVVYSGEKKGADGINYFNSHPAFNLQKVSYTLNMDTIQNKGLPAVKQSILAINALRTHETKTRP